MLFHVACCVDFMYFAYLAQSVYTVASPATTTIAGVPHLIIQQPPHAHLQQHAVPVEQIRVPVGAVPAGAVPAHLAGTTAVPLEAHQQQAPTTVQHIRVPIGSTSQPVEQLTQPNVMALPKGAVVMESSTESPQPESYQERKSHMVTPPGACTTHGIQLHVYIFYVVKGFHVNCFQYILHHNVF